MRKILIIEDNKDISAILRKNLEKNNFSVDIVENGYGVLAYLKKAKDPDAVILDLFIPEIGGIELLGSLISSWPAVKIFVYTAHLGYKEILLRYREISGFFCKTDGIENLIKAIHEQLGE